MKRVLTTARCCALVVGAAVAAMLIPVLAASGQSAGLWKELPSTGLDRQEVSYVQLGGKFYLAGGGTAHQEFDPQTGKWRDLEPLPQKLDHIQGVAVDGKIYYIGGLTSWPSGDVNTVHIFNPNADANGTFTPGSAMLPGRGRGAGGVAAHDGKIYYAGGLADGLAVNWFDVYDPAKNEWAQLPNMPTARDHFQAAVVNGKFWAIGGRNKDIGATLSVNEAYDFSTGTWSSFNTNGYTKRGGFAASPVGDEIFVIGGEGASGAFTTVEAYNTATNAWRSLAPMPERRHGIQGAVCNGGIYIATGGSWSGHQPTDSHYVFFPGGVERPCPEPPTLDPGDPSPTPTPGPGGGTATPGPGDSGDRVRPALERLSASARGRVVRVRVTLSEPATLRLTVERATPGRRLGQRCVRVTRRNRAQLRCIRYVRLARRLVSQPQGRAAARVFVPRLRAGRHRIVAVAVDAAGNRSAPLGKRFDVQRRR